MSYQFIHLETYSRKRTEKTDKKGSVSQKWNVSDILDEANRVPSACTHVENPQPPTLVFGISIDELRSQHDEQANSATCKSGSKIRKIRQDQQTLIGMVASYPDPSDKVGYVQWEEKTIKWLKEKYGDNLKTVVRHDDEAYPHLHIYIIPSADPEMRASHLHEGYAAKAHAILEAREKGCDPKSINKFGDIAYKTAMKAFQESYWQNVGLPCGLTKVGPCRTRDTRDVWKAKQEQAKHVANLLAIEEKATLYIENARPVAKNVREQKEKVKVREESLIAKETAFEEKVTSVTANLDYREEQVELRKSQLIKSEVKLQSDRKVFYKIKADIDGTVNERVSEKLNNHIHPFKETIKKLRSEISEIKTRVEHYLREVCDLKSLLHSRDSIISSQREILSQKDAEILTLKSANTNLRIEKEKFRNLWADADNKLIDRKHGYN